MNAKLALMLDWLYLFDCQVVLIDIFIQIKLSSKTKKTPKKSSDDLRGFFIRYIAIANLKNTCNAAIV